MCVCAYGISVCVVCVWYECLCACVECVVCVRDVSVCAWYVCLCVSVWYVCLCRSVRVVCVVCVCGMSVCA